MHISAALGFNVQMGLCASTEAEGNDRKATEADVFKVLLLGPGDAGKSTIFKQMLNRYGEGFSASDKDDYSAAIHSNVIQSMRILCAETKAPLSSADAKAAKEFIEQRMNG